MSKEKKILVGLPAREATVSGFNKFCDAVSLTHGPYGLNTSSGLEGGVKSSNDGFKTGMDFQCEDENEDVGVRIGKEGIEKVNSAVADNTTLYAVLGKAILKKALTQLPRESKGVFIAGKMGPQALFNKIDKEVQEVIEKLDSSAIPVESAGHLEKVALVSVEDESLAQMISMAQWRLGKDGVLDVEEVNDITSSVEFLNGIKIDNGFSTALLINKQKEGAFEAHDVATILTNHTILDLAVFNQIFQQMQAMGIKQVAIIARAWSSVAVQKCMENHQQGFFVYPLNAPYTNQAEVMQDLEALFGGRFIGEEIGALEDMVISDIGFAEKISSDRNKSLYVGKRDEKAKERIEKRVQELTDLLESDLSSFEKKLILSRRAQLQGGCGIIKVGALTLTERKRKKDKVDDAVGTVRNALEQGVVKGGGLALKEIAESLPDDYILKEALVAPYNQINVNAGFDVERPEWVQDPVKSVKSALIHAAEAARLVAVTGNNFNWKKIKPKDEE